MRQLFKGMYQWNYDHRLKTKKLPSELFGLHLTQPRDNGLVHNGGWFNAAGENLGCGDLALRDFQNIAREIQPEELFIALGEMDSLGYKGNSKDGLRFTKYGDVFPLSVLVRCARFIVASNRLYSLVSLDSKTKQAGFRVLTREKALDLIGRYLRKQLKQLERLLKKQSRRKT